ncbi:amino acid adenylation domain-containing protein [Streptomyces sp. RY43-2]|uniref:Amino acid adenylation domain-containing protein n=1 Tax=Streptomyces macrolidinus TaxID=2952607 RepID=A0ABT0ZJL0_9ACTN|nr:non-ribosomal peptide synthetase [Streptomyces macrolidinus]MCN9243774.1 amino acid adenylation domain-containing protein [Streptomyces macrolidinus]
MASLRERLASLSPEQRAHLAKQLAAPAREKVYPLSAMQQRLWFLERLTPGTTAYVVPAAVRVRGALDRDLLHAAVTELVHRHESLRTTFAERDDTPVQSVAPSVTVEIPEEDLRALPAAAREAACAERIAAEISTPFDLTAGPLLRMRLLRTADDEHLLVVVLHHIISDGWSVTVLFAEFAEIYAAFAEGRPSPLPPLEIQYGDVALRERRHAQPHASAEALRYWKERLAGAPPVLELPPDHPRPPAQSFRGGSWHFDLPARLVRDLAAIGRRRDATPFMVLLALFQVLLHRYCGQDDVVVGIPVAGRERAELERLIGFFVNTLPVRTDLSGDPTFAELLERVRDACLGAYAHQEVPFEKLVEELKPPRDLGRPPIVQISFAYQTQPLPTLRVAGLEFSRVAVRSRTARFDLELQLVEDEGGLSGLFEYNSDLFDEATVARLADHLCRLAREAVADPDRPIGALPLLGDEERRSLSAPGGDTRRTWPEGDLAHLRFARRAREAPTAEAVRCADHALSYAELDRRADQLAHRLRRLGVGRDVLVALCLERSLEMVVALLAVHKAGGAYLPLDPAYPRARLEFMIEDSRAPVVLTQRRVAEHVPSGAAAVLCLDELDEELADEPTHAPGEQPGPGDLAYVIYTSGSTGRPKGVQITHGALANFLRSMQERPGIARDDVLLAVTSLSFDISVLELLLPLVAGARVVVAPRDVAADGPALAEALDAAGATLMQATPSTWRMLVESGWAGRRHLRMLCGGEALPPSLAGRLRPLGAELWNMYGPTETTIWSAVSRIDTGPISLGEPIANTELIVLDRRGQLVPTGVPGELHIGGAGLARGYLNQPELTADRFVAHPAPNDLGERLYRTGDLVRRRGDGSIEFLGRIDFQVKVRGFRIELGEIEQALTAHPGVSAAVVTAREHAGDTRLVAHLACAEAPEPAEIAAFLRDSLPAYMVPSAFVFLTAFPLTPNGKIDRAALPEPEFGRADLRTPYRAPAEPLERTIADVFADLLGVDQVGADDDFFALGGHSLLATQVTTRLRSVLGVELPLRELFERPTVSALAYRLRERGAQPRTGTAPGDREVPTVPRRADPALPVPPAFAQRRLWFLEQLSAGNRAYLIPAALRVRGRLDAAVFRRACDEVMRRHEALRAVFPEIDGRPRLVVRPEVPAELEVRDLAGPDDVEEQVRARAESFFARPFRLSDGPLLRFELLRVSAEESVVLLAMHHIVSDQWSLGVLLREVLALYAAFAAGRPSPLPELPVQYPDFALWQQEALGRQTDGDALDHWVRRLSGAPAELNLSPARPRPPEKSYRGAALELRLDPLVVRRLRALARQEGATLFMVLTGAFQTLLARLSGVDDVVIGTPVAGRRLPELEPLIGLFVNTLALRTDLSGDPSFRELLGRVRRVCLDAYDHQDVPFERLVEALKPERSLARTPIFQVGFALQNVPFPAWSGGGLHVEPIPADGGTAKFDLELLLSEDGDTVHGRLEYSLDLFDAPTADRIARCLQRLLTAVADRPDEPIGRLPILDEAERREVLALGEGGPREWPDAGLLHQMFEAQADATPHAEALRFEGERLTYAELDRRANQLAHRLRRSGVGRDVLVGICMERSTELVVALLATLKAGGAYLPLDPGYPRSRLEFMLADARVPVLLTQRRLVPGLPDHEAVVLCVDEAAEDLGRESGERPRVRVGGEDLAYVIYTSGSTGRPKGVMNVHAGIRNRLLWMQDAYRLDASDRVLQKTPYSFDVSVWEFFWPLTTGACLVVARPEGHKDGRYLVETVQREGITTLHFVPAMLQVFLRDDGAKDCRGLRRVICSGEALPRELQERFFALLPAELHNLYGPTEAAVDVTAWACRRDGDTRPVPIGHAIANTQMYVLDPALRPVPRGVAGELCIGGRNLARGYLDRPELTAERFVPHPFDPDPGARIYRTGDLARFRDDGAIEYLGRLDHQVKLRGLRIELGEIEQVLAAHPAVREAVVTARGQGGDTRLVAYLTADEPPTAGELITHLKERLPDYMVPAAFVPLPAFPLSPNGKVDRAALPAPELSRPELAVPYLAPRDRVERTVAEAWTRLLGLDQVGVDDNFFELGGHSLLMAELRSTLETELRRPLTLVELFQFPTVRTLAEHLAGTPGTAADPMADARGRVAGRREAMAARRAAAGRRSRNRNESEGDRP